MFFVKSDDFIVKHHTTVGHFNVHTGVTLTSTLCTFIRTWYLQNSVLKRNLRSLSGCSLFLLTRLWQPANPMRFLVLDVSYKGNRTWYGYGAFCVWLLSLSIFSGLILAPCFILMARLFCLDNGYFDYFTFFPLYWIFWIELLWTYVYKILIEQQVFLWGYIPSSFAWPCDISMFIFLRDSQYVFLRSCAIWQYHR